VDVVFDEVKLTTVPTVEKSCVVEMYPEDPSPATVEFSQEADM
jgi:hypothetical protein